MPKIVHCHKLNQDLPALDSAPLPGPIGEKILKNISAQAWDAWIVQQTMLINENRLSVIDPEARKFLEEAMLEFLFGDGGSKPAGYKPIDQD
jgi:Fe-S cluster biosynthesis and repair protein YggX